LLPQYPSQVYPVGYGAPEPFFEKPQKDSSEKLPDVETTPSQV
jgi:hypothetical protein